MFSDILPKSHASALLTNTILVVLFLSAAITDLRWKKIYNYQTYPAMICGLIIGWIAGGVPGLLASLGGLVVGLSLLLIFYMLGGVGAGDVKLLGAIGALKGATFILYTMFYAGLVGGAMAFAIIIWSGTVKQTMKNLLYFLRHPLRAPREQKEEEYQYLPYGFAISLGCLCALCTL